MATYYISAKVDGEQLLYIMNCTERVTSTSTGELSTHKLENAQYASDNYRNNPNSFSLSGVLSDIYVGSSIAEKDKKTTKDYIEGLDRIKNDKIPFTLHYASDLTPRYPCFFTKFEHSQDRTHGFSGISPSGKHVNSYLVSMDITQTRIGRSATFTTGKASEFVDPTQIKTKSSSSTQGVEDGVDSDNFEAWRQIFRGADQTEESLLGVDLPGGS